MGRIMKYNVRLLRPTILSPQDPKVQAAAVKLKTTPEKLAQLVMRSVGSAVASTSNASQAEALVRLLASVGVQSAVQSDEETQREPQSFGDGSQPLLTETSIRSLDEEHQVAPSPLAAMFQPVTPPQPLQQPAQQPVTPAQAVSQAAKAASERWPSASATADPWQPMASNLASPPKASGQASAQVAGSNSGQANTQVSAQASAQVSAQVSAQASGQQYQEGHSDGHNDMQHQDGDTAGGNEPATAAGRGRASLRPRVLLFFVIPVLLVALGLVVYTLSTLPNAFRRALASQAVTASTLAARLMLKDAAEVPKPSALSSLNGNVRRVAGGIPDLAFVVLRLQGSDPIINDTIRAQPDLAGALAATLGTLQSNNNSGRLEYRGSGYVIGVSAIQSTPDSPNLGEVYIGLKSDSVQKEVNNALVVFVLVVVAALLVALLAAMQLANSLIRPIVAATEQANRISLGDLEQSVAITSNDELGDLLSALERMRTSLTIMMERLRTRRK
jgi:HAMP domain-containing protein